MPNSPESAPEVNTTNQEHSRMGLREFSIKCIIAVGCIGTLGIVLINHAAEKLTPINENIQELTTKAAAIESKAKSGEKKIVIGTKEVHDARCDIQDYKDELNQIKDALGIGPTTIPSSVENGTTTTVRLKKSDCKD